MRIVAMDGAPLSLPSTSAAGVGELQHLREALQIFRSRAIKWNQLYPNVTLDIEQSLVPALERLEEAWSTSVH